MSEVEVTQADQQAALKIVHDAEYDGELNDDVSHEQLQDAIALALAQAREEGFNDGRRACNCPQGSILDCTGEMPVVRKVLGELVYTKDGYILGSDCTVWFQDRCGEVIGWEVGKADHDIPVGVYYSSREAAESAREAASE